MLTDAPDASTVRRLLENLELKIVLDSPGKRRGQKEGGTSCFMIYFE